MSENRFRAWYRSGADRPLVLAHRGDSYHAPENTLEAARIALEAGADGWELDVRMTRDGALVVLHDESLLRTTDVARRFEGDPRAAQGFLVAEFTLEEVRSLDAGSWFVEPSGGQRSAAKFGTLSCMAEIIRSFYGSGRVRVPTLGEALRLTDQFGGLVNVEVKPVEGDPAALVDAVVGAIRVSDAVDRVAVSSFDHRVVGLVVARESGLATGALVERPPDRPAVGWLRALGADALHAPPSALGPMTSGVPVLVYTINDAGPGGLAGRLAEAGVAGLFTDDPASLIQMLGISPSSVRTRSH